MNPNQSKHIFLIGLRGSGKSTLAPLLAQHWSMPWVDMDVIVAHKAGCSIRDIIQTQGVAAFRELETQILHQLILGPPTVIATGGGVILSEQNRSLMQQSGWVIWLHADVATLWKRIQTDPQSAATRPALGAKQGLEELREQIQQRLPLYKACADLMLDTTRNSHQALIELIEKHRPS